MIFDKSTIKYFKDSLLYLPSQIVPAIIGIILISIYSRVFYPDEYGYYSIVMITINFLTIFLLSWVYQAIIRFYPYYNKRNRSDHLISTSMIYLLLINVIILFITFFIILLTSDCIIIIFYMYFITDTLIIYINNLLRIKMKIKLRTLNVIVKSIIYIVIFLTLILIFEPSILFIFIGYALINIVLIIVNFIILKLKIKLSFFRKKIMLKIFNYGFPLIFLSLFMFILSVSDRYMILYFINRKAVGIYSPVYDLFNAVFSFIYNFLIMAAFPLLVYQWEEYRNIRKVTRFIKKIIAIYIVMIVPLFIIILLFEDLIMNILGEKYLAGKVVIKWVIFGFALFGFTYFLNKGLELRRNTKKMALMVITSGLINIIFNIVLIPKYGIEGAAISTFISYVCYFIFSLYTSKYYLSWKELFSLKLR